MLPAWRFHRGPCPKTAQGMYVDEDVVLIFFFQAEDGIRDLTVTGVQTCALPIYTEAKLVITADGGWRGGHAVELKAAADQALASGCKSVRRVIVLKRTGQPISMDPSRDLDRKSTRLNSSHSQISYAVFCLKKKKP